MRLVMVAMVAMVVIVVIVVMVEIMVMIWLNHDGQSSIRLCLVILVVEQVLHHPFQIWMKAKMVLTVGRK